MGYYIYFLKTAFFTSQYIMYIFPCKWVRPRAERGGFAHCAGWGGGGNFMPVTSETPKIKPHKKLKLRRCGKVHEKNANKVQVAILISGKTELEAEHIKWDKDGSVLPSNA